MPCAPSQPLLVSKCTVFPDKKSTMDDLKLSVSDLPMLSCHYIQKGLLFNDPPVPILSLISLLKNSLSQTLSIFPPLAGRFVTDSKGYIYINCNHQGADFIHSKATHLSIDDILSPIHVPDCVKSFFTYDGIVSYEAHWQPIAAVQVTELADGVFIGCSVCHAVADGTSFWNFFNCFADLTRGLKHVRNFPDFTRKAPIISDAVLEVPEGGPKITFDLNQPIKERIFSFSKEAILKLKSKVNETNNRKTDDVDHAELMGKQSNDPLHKKATEISSFQSLSALLWRAVTRGRKLNPTKTTTFRMAVNCRERLSPKLDKLYFGNAIQSIPTYATVGDVLSRDLRWAAELLNKNVKAHDNNMIRRYVEIWEMSPKCFPLGNSDGASITIGSSPRFPMFDNDFGWGRPLAIRSGKANKFDGKISAFPGREGAGSVDLEVILAPETMAAIESDWEFMQFVSQ